MRVELKRLEDLVTSQDWMSPAEYGEGEIGYHRLTIISMLGRIRDLETALQNIGSEVAGLRIAVKEITEAIGVTNWNCLMLRYTESREVLKND